MTEMFVVSLLLLGSLFIFISGLGIVRFQDTISRAHALSKALTFGLMLVFGALLMVIGTFTVAVKVIFAVLLLMVTIPVSGHIFALYVKKGR